MSTRDFEYEQPGQDAIPSAPEGAEGDDQGEEE